jgi:acetyltransferase-like isoleucine patch superfamily enzyme
MIKQFFLSFIEDRLRNISGGLGKRLRYYYYRRRLAACGQHVFIDTGVHFTSPNNIYVGDHVWIDKNCILIAGEIKAGANIEIRDNARFTGHKGCIYIGSHSHVGINTVIQGHGGVYLGDYFTTSAHCRIYSYSNDYRKCHYGTMETGGKENIHYILQPVYAGNNVWLGLNVSVISTIIEDDVFVLPHGVVYKPLTANSVAGGNPAVKINDRF